MSLTCGYSSPRSDGHANPQITGVRVQVPPGHERFAHGAMRPVLRLSVPRRAGRRLGAQMNSIRGGTSVRRFTRFAASNISPRHIALDHPLALRCRFLGKLRAMRAGDEGLTSSGGGCRAGSDTRAEVTRLVRLTTQQMAAPGPDQNRHRRRNSRQTRDAGDPQPRRYEIGASCPAVTFRTGHLFRLAPVRCSSAIRAGLIDVTEPLDGSSVYMQIEGFISW